MTGADPRVDERRAIPPDSARRLADAQTRTPWWRGAIATFAAAGLSYAVLAWSTSPWVFISWAVALTFLAPTAARLDRRLTINLALVLGFLPVVLWLPALPGTLPAAAWSLGASTVAVVAAGAFGSVRILPQIRRTDGVIALMGAVAAMVAFPLLTAQTPARALAMLSTGIDNSYHYAMYLEQRLAAAGSPLVAANADASGFAFDDYPQWFHKLLGVLGELGYGAPGSAPVELVRYAQLQWVAFVGLAVLVTAAFLQALPDRVPAYLLVPATTLLAGLLLGVPGALNLIQGHLSFLVAACAPLVMFLLAVNAPRPGLGLVVVLSGLVLVTASWVLLLPMAFAALLLPTVAIWRRQRAFVRWAVVACAGLASVAALALFALGPLTRGGFLAVLRDGTVPEVRLPLLLGTLVGSVALMTFLARRHRGAALAGHLLVTVAAALPVLVLGAYMLWASGSLTYYFWKLALGSLLVSVMVSTHGVIRVCMLAPDARRPGRLRLLASASVVLIAVAGLGSGLQNFTSPSFLWAAFLPSSLEDRVSSGTAGDVDLVLRLARSARPADAARTRLLATRAEDMNPAHASEWFHALSHSATHRAMSVDDGVYDLAVDRSDLPLAVALASATLREDDGQVIVTNPLLLDAIGTAVPPSQLARVVLVP